MRPAESGQRRSASPSLLGACCLLVALLASRTAMAGCPAGTLETGQYRTETQSAIVVHHVCTPLAQLTPGQIVIDGLEDLAMQLGWSAADRARLAAALNSLDLPAQYAHTAESPIPWSVIVARGGNAQLAREAAAGVGPDLWSAGTQTNYDDCALYALAVATGRPYGVIAALATTLIGEESWRTDASDPSPPTPQAVIENGGLNGGETIFLAQSLGQVSVVTPNEFDRTLQAGQPIMTAVFTSSEPGNKIRHEVVLTKAFEHDGAPWYEMVDSARQGALRPLYVSEPELHSILAENGVVYSPRPGTTPALLR